jgi:hypothetical protein
MTKAFTELLDKRAEFAAHQDGLKAEIAKIGEDIAALDRVLVLLDPSYQPANGTKRRRRSNGIGFSRGELSEGVLEVMRDPGDPMTVAQCAEELATLKGIPTELLPRLKANVAATLTHLAKRKRIRRSHNGDGRTVHWQVDRYPE